MDTDRHPLSQRAGSEAACCNITEPIGCTSLVSSLAGPPGEDPHTQREGLTKVRPASDCLTAAALVAILPCQWRAGCDEHCSIPEQGSTGEQEVGCRLSGLPDLNHSVPFVREQLADWTNWMLDRYRCACAGGCACTAPA